jgi:hypothetical protein
MSAPRALACPSCGGTVAPPLGARKTHCSYCGKDLFYTGEDFLPCLVLPRGVTDGDLHQTSLKLFKSPLLPSGLKKKALLLQKHRTYIPFYLLTGKRGGVLATGRERIKTPLPQATIVDRMAASSGDRVSSGYQFSRPEVVVEEDSRVVLGDFRYLYPAVSLESWDFFDEDLRDVVTANLDAARPASIADLVRDGEVVDANIPLRTIVEKGVASFSKVTGDLKVLELTALVVYVPVQFLTFRYRGEIVSITIEEVQGANLSGRLPFRRDWAFLVGLALIAILAFFVGQFGRTLLEFMGGTEAIRQDWAGTLKALAVVCAVVGVIVAAGLNAAWVFFRTPFYVRLRKGSAVIASAGEMAPSPLNPVNGLLRAGFHVLFQSRRNRMGERL